MKERGKHKIAETLLVFSFPSKKRFVTPDKIWLGTPDANNIPHQSQK